MTGDHPEQPPVHSQLRGGYPASRLEERLGQPGGPGRPHLDTGCDHDHVGAGVPAAGDVPHAPALSESAHPRTPQEWRLRALVDEEDVGRGLAHRVVRPQRAVELQLQALAGRVDAEFLDPVEVAPLAGQDGKKMTARLVKARLDAELIGNVSIRVLPTERPDTWEVQGRGELQLAVLVEMMRREGFELTVGKPQVLTREIDVMTINPSGGWGNWNGPTETQRAVGFHEVRENEYRETYPLGRGMPDVQLLVLRVAVDDRVSVDPNEPTRRVTQPQQLPHGMSAEGVGLEPTSPCGQ